MTASTQTRIDRVLGHIRDNPAGDLSLDRLADIAALSRFHFHRTFHAMTGETVAEAVRRTRLNRAAVLLALGREPRAATARAVGYADPDAFARAFRTAFGLTPAAARRAGRVLPPILPPKKGVLPMFPVEIRSFPETRLAALAHHGPYPAIGATFDRLWHQMAAAGLVARIAGPAVALYHDDPAAVPASDLRADAALTIADDAQLPAGLTELVLPAGRAAVLTYRGPYAGLPEPWAWLYAGWLPASGEVPATRPPFERYLNAPATTAPADLLTEIVLPLA